MGQPQHTNNVRRVDFAKASTRASRTRSKEAEAPTRSSDRDHLKVVPLPDTRRRRPRRSVQKLQTLAIVIMAALLGAFIAALLLDPAL